MERNRDELLFLRLHLCNYITLVFKGGALIDGNWIRWSRGVVGGCRSEKPGGEVEVRARSRDELKSLNLNCYSVQRLN